MQNYKHWRIETDENKIAWLYFDKQHAVVNTIDHEVMEEFSHLLDKFCRERLAPESESQGICHLGRLRDSSCSEAFLST